MAIYHFSAKAMRRSAGRSIIAAAAYRSGSAIIDAKSSKEYDYTRKRGVLHSELILPFGFTVDRSTFWNDVEKHHKRGDAVVAREVEVSLPKELTQAQRQELAVSYAKYLVDRYGVAADVCLHAPRTITDRDFERKPDQYYEIDPETGRRHNANWHAHILLSACSVRDDGSLGKKVVALDPIHCQHKPHKQQNFIDYERENWADFVNTALLRNKKVVQVDHRSLADQGIDCAPTRHIGPAAVGYEGRTGKKSARRRDIETGMNRANADEDGSDEDQDEVKYAGSENNYDDDHDDYDRPDWN